METLKLPASVKEILELARGASLEDKVSNLVLSDIEKRLGFCVERILDFEKKYGMNFKEFEEAWQRDEIPEKYSHEIEHDYMEWESLDDEHDLLLSQIKKIKEDLRHK